LHIFDELFPLEATQGTVQSMYHSPESYGSS
jgi:hypothetical protein